MYIKNSLILKNTIKKRGKVYHFAITKYPGGIIVLY